MATSSLQGINGKKPGAGLPCSRVSALSTPPPSSTPHEYQEPSRPHLGAHPSTYRAAATLESGLDRQGTGRSKSSRAGQGIEPNLSHCDALGHILRKDDLGPGGMVQAGLSQGNAIKWLALMCDDAALSSPSIQRRARRARQAPRQSAHPHRGIGALASPGLAAGQEGHP